MDDLDRFVIAQEGVHQQAIGELEMGHKAGHWMWFVFPQIAGLGMSPMSQRYAIADLGEAHLYLTHPILGPRLVGAAEEVLGWAGERSAEEIFGSVDAVKLRSSATLFEAAGGEPVFGRILDAFFGGERDPATLSRI